jgi:hypothetical protein
MRGSWLAAVTMTMVAALALAGCGGAPSGKGVDASRSSTTTGGLAADFPAAVSDDGALRIRVQVSTFLDGFVADLSVRNVGPATVYLPDLRTSCGAMPWVGTLFGPAGTDLVYQDPEARLECAGWTSYPLESGSWANWTADPTCQMSDVCPHRWDGRIWTPGSRTAAPARDGGYTWRFELSYCVAQAPGTPVYGCPGGLRSIHADVPLPVESAGKRPFPTDGVVPSRKLRTVDGVHLADLAVHNGGDQTLTYNSAYCVPSTWAAKLSGPPGDGLTYRDPADNRLGCPGQTGVRLEPDGWVNWTASKPCTTHRACDNVWDGRLWQDGQASTDPPGTYTWLFWFPYQKPLDLSDGERSLRPSVPRAVHVDLTVVVP